MLSSGHGKERERLMGYVLPPPHDPKLSYEENLRILRNHYRGDIGLRVVLLSFSVTAFVVFVLILLTGT